ncbi:MAG: hypothetical protein ACW98X_07355 [Promethearchaeota archaeon]|jgi:predicted MFS family arabinose efflux permease
MENNFEELEKTVKVRNRGDIWVAVVVIMIVIFIMVGGIILHYTFFLPTAGGYAGLVSVPLIALGLASALGGIIYPYRKRIRRVGCYCLVLLLLSYYLSYFLMFLLPR